VGAFRVFLLAHLLGDFPCQPYALLRWKLTSIRGLLAHVGIQAALAVPVLAWLVPAWGWWLLVLVLTHFLIDWTKVRFIRGGWFELGAFFLDQALHIAVLWAIVRLSGAQVVLTGTAAAVVRWGTIFVLAGYAGAVVVFLVDAAFHPRGGGFQRIPARQWWTGMVERSVAVLAVLLLPWGVGLLAAAAYAVGAAVRLRRSEAWLPHVVSIGWVLAVTLAVT